ncbi:LysM peptidoglycan-binding domain-containing protein [Gemmatimonadota bacterium]
MPSSTEGGSSRRLDALLDAPWARSPELEPEIQDWISNFQARGGILFRDALTRRGRYRATVEEELGDLGLPPSLSALPIVESWYSPWAVSWVGAAGLWQFMAPTARGMGLTVNRLVDERRDPFLSTPLALAYLAELRERFGSWFLALAAYNGGPGRLERLLRRRAPDRLGSDGLFLEIRSELPRETQEFIPKFLAAARIARDPGAYGFGDVEEDPPLEFDEVEVPDATSLDVAAEAAGVGLDRIEALNPQLLRGLTPAGVPTRIRVPSGSGPTFQERYALIPPEERVTFVEHAVVRGETLTHLARMYGVSVEDLRAANPRVRPRFLQIGQRVVVPKAPSFRDRLRDPSRIVEEGEERVLLYRVRSGDTLSGIAERHNVAVRDLLRWNGLSRSSVIYPDDEIRIFLTGG